MWTRIQARLGGWLLAAVTAAARRRLGVQVHEHVGTRSRRTPWLELGTPRRGTLVWLHGFSDQPESFLRTAAHLVDDFRIIAPAMPAFGNGWRDPVETHNASAFARWMRELLDDVLQDEPAHLVGNSLGGVTALKVAAQRPPWLRSVVALNSAGMRVRGVPSVLEEFEDGEILFEVRTWEDYQNLLGRLFTKPLVPPLIDRHMFREYARQADWFVRVARELSESELVATGEGWESAVALEAIDVPTLVLWGDQDTLFPVTHAELMAQHIPRGRLELIEGVGHCPHIESPSRLAASVRRFVQDA